MIILVHLGGKEVIQNPLYMARAGLRQEHGAVTYTRPGEIEVTMSRRFTAGSKQSRPSAAWG